jgi:peptide/nickel transport system ATP-binding protein
VIVEVDDLTIDFWSRDRWLNVVNGVDFAVYSGEALGLVGESGCGKTTTAVALLGKRRKGSRIRKGSIRFLGNDVLSAGVAALRRLRGKQVSLVPQNPTTALSPGMRVGNQIAEAMKVHHHGGSRAAVSERVHELLRQVRLPQPVRTARMYPHQLSGGQQQRVTIAMALACEPKLIVLDEPTTGLDVTTQAQILELLAGLREELGLAMVYVTHNLGVVTSICDRVGVMYAGMLIEEAPTSELFRNPRHPYTQGLIAAVPSVKSPRAGRSVLLQGLLQREQLPSGCRFAPRCHFAVDACFVEPQSPVAVGPDHQAACMREPDIPALAAREAAAVVHAVPRARSQTQLQVGGIDCAYEFRRGWRTLRREPRVVVRDVSFELRHRETYALVGESGSGKSTIARAVGGLLVPTAGEIAFDGVKITVPVARRPRDLRRAIQLVLQNPDASLNPLRRVSQIVGRPLELYYGLGRKERQRRVASLLDDVRLPAAFQGRYPDELSGGERQRVAIARALAAEPKLMLCDEILSALDVSVQADVLDLLRKLQAEHGLSYLFISHDLAVVRSISHRVGVLYRGRLVEEGDVEDVYSPPYHPYTHVLLSAVPELDTERPPTPAVQTDAEPAGPEAFTGCPFAHRCPWKVGPICDTEMPPWRATSETHAIRCHIPPSELLEREADAGA